MLVKRGIKIVTKPRGKQVSNVPILPKSKGKNPRGSQKEVLKPFSSSLKLREPISGVRLLLERSEFVLDEGEGVLRIPGFFLCQWCVAERSQLYWNKDNHVDTCQQ